MQTQSIEEDHGAPGSQSAYTVGVGMSVLIGKVLGLPWSPGRANKQLLCLMQHVVFPCVRGLSCLICSCVRSSEGLRLGASVSEVMYCYGFRNWARWLHFCLFVKLAPDMEDIPKPSTLTPTNDEVAALRLMEQVDL